MLFSFLDRYVILYMKNGNYKQAQLAVRDNLLHAALGPNTFVRLIASHATTNPSIRWVYIEADVHFEPNKLGHLVLNAVGS